MTVIACHRNRRDYFKFPQAFSASEPGEWSYVSIGSDRPATLDDVTNFAKAIQARSAARVGIIHVRPGERGRVREPAAYS